MLLLPRLLEWLVHEDDVQFAGDARMARKRRLVREERFRGRGRQREVANQKNRTPSKISMAGLIQIHESINQD